MCRILAIALLMMLGALTPIGIADETREFFGPTGHPYSGYVGTLERELNLIRMHFDISDQDAQSLSEAIAEHRDVLKRMDDRMATLVRHYGVVVRRAGGFVPFHEQNPDFGSLMVSKHEEIMEAQQALEARLVDKIRSILQPEDEAVWKDYWLTRDFERWRQPSRYESLGETIDPYVLFHKLDPQLTQNPEFLETLRVVRSVVHREARDVVDAFRKAEQYTILTKYHQIERDGEKEHELYEEAQGEARRLAKLLWVIPDRFAESGLTDADARSFRDLFSEMQNLSSSTKALDPIRESVRYADLVQDALQLPDLSDDQRRQLLSIWTEMNEAYDRALEVHFRICDAQYRDPIGSDLDLFSERMRILDEAKGDPAEIAQILTSPQWYSVVGYPDSWRRRLSPGLPKAMEFDWSSLNFEELVPE